MQYFFFVFLSQRLRQTCVLREVVAVARGWMDVGPMEIACRFWRLYSARSGGGWEGCTEGLNPEDEEEVKKEEERKRRRRRRRSRKLAFGWERGLVGRRRDG